jgi:hypothetical protein
MFRATGESNPDQPASHQVIKLVYSQLLGQILWLRDHWAAVLRCSGVNFYTELWQTGPSERSRGAPQAGA